MRSYSPSPGIDTHSQHRGGSRNNGKNGKSSENVSLAEREAIKSKILQFLNKENMDENLMSFSTKNQTARKNQESLTNIQNYLHNARPPKTSLQPQPTSGSITSSVTVTQRRNSSTNQKNPGDHSRSIDQNPIENIRTLIDRLSVMNEEPPHTNHIDFGVERVLRPKKKIERTSSVSSGLRYDLIEGEELIGTLKESTEFRERLNQEKERPVEQRSPPRESNVIRAESIEVTRKTPNPKNNPNQSKSSPYSIKTQKPLTSVSSFPLHFLICSFLCKKQPFRNIWL